jgi:hypothetical protein
MTKNTFIALIGFIVALPFLYLLMINLQPEDPILFHGVEVVTLDPADGTIITPSEADAEKNAPLLATFTSAFVEKITGKRINSTKGLELTIRTVSDTPQECDDNSQIPINAKYNVAETCAPYAFEKLKDEKKTAILIVPEERMIVFGSSGKNLVRVYHGELVGTYVSPDMTQSDRKYEACLARIMMYYAFGFDLEKTKTCIPQK